MIRTIDQSKCVGCGTCQRICPLDVFRLDINQPEVSPCMVACPISNNIRGIHYLLEMGRVDEAARMMLENNPLASVTGRICPHFCESKCTRNQVDAAVNISAIEQYLGDYLLEKEVERVPRRHVAQVAVVGSGPAGLSCAYFLAADGFQVTVFEAEEEPGGMLRYAIPEYRLPGRVVVSLIERLQNMGVIIKCSETFNATFTLDSLRSQGFGAVFLGLGAVKVKKIQVEGIDTEPSSLPREIVGPGGIIKVAPGACQTSIPNIFAVRDAAKGSASVVKAIGGGKRAAQAIMLYLRGLELEGLPLKDMPVAEGLPKNAQLQRSMRHEKRRVAETGNRDFPELYRGFDLAEALAEADRCMTCGAKSVAAYMDDCMTCFSCEINCPGEAIFVHPFKEILPRTLSVIEG